MDMDAERLPRVFGAVVRELREGKGFSQEGFAHHCGVHRTYMGSVERGQSVVTLTTGMKIAEGLDMPFHRLMEAVELALSRPGPL